MRLASLKGGPISFDEFGFPEGFGKNNQAVLIPAFLSAYSGNNPEKISLNPISKNPLPNWSIQYTGLIKNEFLKNDLKDFQLTLLQIKLYHK